MNEPTALHEVHKGHEAHEVKLMAFFVRFVLIVCPAVGPFGIDSGELWT
jgi:hypothetical protein